VLLVIASHVPFARMLSWAAIQALSLLKLEASSLRPPRRVSEFDTTRRVYVIDATAPQTPRPRRLQHPHALSGIAGPHPGLLRRLCPRRSSRHPYLTTDHAFHTLVNHGEHMVRNWAVYAWFTLSCHLRQLMLHPTTNIAFSHPYHTGNDLTLLPDKKMKRKALQSPSLALSTCGHYYMTCSQTRNTTAGSD